ncbi:MAG: PIN domain-containing protein, partial [Candidatus Nanoarchaeia archaeon]|nr:PIN domain-containing protein [Candidatus Nanoarchaeia archaeon]
ALHEIRKYKELVLKKSELQEQKYEDLLNKLMNCVILVPEEPIKQHLDEADAEFKKLNEIVGQQLNEGKENTKEMQLLKSIKQKRDIIKANPFYGDNIEKKKIPKEYNVQNL